MLVRRMHRLHHLPTSTLRRVPSHLAQPRRGFVGGAFETEFEESRAKVRRKRINAFLAALETLPNEAGHAQEEAQSLVRSILSEYAPQGRFDSRDHLASAIGAVQGRLSEWQTPGVLKLDWAADRELKALGLPSDEGSGDAAGGGQASASGASTAVAAPPDAPPQQSAAAAAYAAATPQAAATPPPDDDDPPEPDVLSEEQRRTVVALQTSVALEALPSLWHQLPRATFVDPHSFAEASASSAGASSDGSPDGGGRAHTVDDASVPLSVALDAAAAISSLDPWDRIRLHVRLTNGGAEASTPSTAQLKVAALTTAEGAYSLTTALLRRFEMLSDAESERMDELRAAKSGDAAMVVSEIRRKPMLTRAWHRLRGGGAAGGTDRDVAAADRSDSALYACLESERALQEGLTKALFAYHDRLSTRRRRRRNAVKYTLLFFSLNILDFIITNM